MAVNKESYYSGLHTFNWLSESTGLAVDEINFVVWQISALFLAGFLRIKLRPDVVGPTVRHAFSVGVGLLLGFFCFGCQTVHLAGLPALCYIVIRTQDPRFMQRIVLALALGYLSCIHLHRQIYAYGSYTLDITGPLMVITQKVISLAYSIHDGVTRLEKDLTPLQKHHAIKIMPTTLEYFGFIFQFQTLMVGPLIYYRDYIDWIHGNHLKGGQHLSAFYDDGSNRVNVIEPSPTQAVIKKIVAGLTCTALFLVFLPVYPFDRVKEKEFLENTGTLYKLWYMYVASFFVRCKYYYAWLFAEAICNYSGIGFNGVDADGNQKWDGVSNVDPLAFETSLNLKGSIDAWNKGTNQWLRMIVYERVKKHKLILTFSLSAIWHGFYPGYYLTFATGALLTIATRSVRRHVRPLFVGTAKNSIVYDALTFMASRIYMTYLTFSFILLEFTASVNIYKSMYLIPHFLALAAIIITPLFPKPHTIKQNGNAKKINKQVTTCDTTSTNNDQAEIHNGTAKKVN